MQIMDRDFRVLELLAVTHVMSNKRIDELVFQASRQCRRRLKELIQARYINRCPKKHDPARKPYYYLARPGLEFLANRLDRPEYLAKPTKLQPRIEHLIHTESVGEFLLNLPRSFARRDDLKLVQYCHEFEPANPLAEESKWTRLYTEISTRPRVVSQPDAAFVAQRGNDQVPYLVEYETGNTGFKAVASRKPNGYQQLAKTGRHRLWFPSATSNRCLVLVICPTPAYRDRLSDRVKALHPEEHHYWRYVANEDTNPEIFLTQAVIRSTRSEGLEQLIAPA